MDASTQAGRIIAKFGGISALAAAGRFPKTTVQRWSQSGLIHPRHNEKVLAAAKTAGVELNARDFLTIDPAHPSLTPAAA